MTEPGRPDQPLDQQLTALFAGLDTRPDFNARLRARLQIEHVKDARAVADRARELELQRYREARGELLTPRHWIEWIWGLLRGEHFGLSVLELAGGAVLGLGAVASML